MGGAGRDVPWGLAVPCFWGGILGAVLHGNESMNMEAVAGLRGVVDVVLAPAGQPADSVIGRQAEMPPVGVAVGSGRGSFGAVYCAALATLYD